MGTMGIEILVLNFERHPNILTGNAGLLFGSAIDYDGGSARPSENYGVGIHSIRATTLDDMLFPGTVATYKKSRDLVPQDNVARELQKAVPSEEVEKLYKADMDSPFGRTLREVAAQKGYNVAREPDFYTWLNMPEEVYAVTITLNNGAVILGYNKAHQDMIRNNQKARQHINFGTYINGHEGVHVWGEQSEPHTDGVVADALDAYGRKLDLLKDWVEKEREIAGNFAQYGRQRIEGYRTGAIPLALPKPA